MGDQHDALEFARDSVDDDLARELVDLEERLTHLFTRSLDSLTERVNRLERDVEQLRQNARP
jgi:polyhydroxyalkanoate synthesis regulator phasin